MVWNTLGRLLILILLGCTDLGDPSGQAPGRARAALSDAEVPHGSGCFGRWEEDRFGLPAYVYQPVADGSGERGCAALVEGDPVHQLGNTTATALAHAAGHIELFTMRTFPLFLNRADPDTGNHAGGFGWVRDGERVWSTLYPDRDPAAVYERVFGAGYFQKTVRVGEVELSDFAFMPIGDDEVILQEISLTNHGPVARELAYVAYWDLAFWQPKPPLSQYANDEVWTSRDPVRQALFARSTAWPGNLHAPTRTRDPQPKTALLALLDGTTTGFDTVQKTFFGKGTRQLPEQVARGKLNNSLTSFAPLPNHKALFALESRVTLAPGETRKLTFLFGWAPRGRASALVDRFRARHQGARQRMLAYFEKRLPRLSLPALPWLERELRWSAYYLLSGQLREDYFGARVLNQGSDYLYLYGKNIALRDPLQHVLPLSYLAPEVTRDTLRYVMRTMDPAGRIPYGVEGYGVTCDFYWEPSDLALWLFWTVAEYVNATRDLGFLEELQPTYQGLPAPVHTLLERAFAHQVNRVGKGRHGLVRMQNADWNDLIVKNSADPVATRRDGESTMNTAIAVAVYPALAALVRARGDTAFAARIEQERALLLHALREQWRDDHLNRAYVNAHAATEVGADNLFLEPNAFALLVDDLLTRDQVAALVARMESHLFAGQALGFSLQGPLGEPPYDDPIAFGMWYAISGVALQGLARQAPGHEPAARLAWAALEKTTLAAHAEAYPRLWYGIWSGPDSFYDNRVSPPEQAGTSWMSLYPVTNMHAHSQPLQAVLRLAGIWADRDGYSIRPANPAQEFTLETPLIGVRYGPDRLSGYVAALARDRVRLQVALPPRLQGLPLEVCIDGRSAPYQRTDVLLETELVLSGLAPTRWEVRPESATGEPCPRWRR